MLIEANAIEVAITVESKIGDVTVRLRPASNQVEQRINSRVTVSNPNDSPSETRASRIVRSFSRGNCISPSKELLLNKAVCECIRSQHLQSRSVQHSRWPASARYRERKSCCDLVSRTVA